MTTKILTLLCGFIILILGFIYDSPIEVTFHPGYRIATLILAVLVSFTFFFLFSQSLKLKPKGIKFAALGLTGLIFLPYLWIGLWTIPPALFSSHYPMYEDISTYKNEKGELLVGQFMELSGSLHHSQVKKILYNFGNGIRISYLYPEKKINGIWEYHQFQFNNGLISNSDTTYQIEFKNGREIR